MFDIISYWIWRRKAVKALKKNLTAVCNFCHEPIFPGDFVGIAENKEGKTVLIHAGFHYSLNSRNAICETGVVGSAVWDGKRVISTCESLLDKAFQPFRNKSG